MKILEDLYRTAFGAAPDSLMPMAQAGSGRRYFRLTGLRNVVGTIGTDLRENKAFFELSKHWEGDVPEVLAMADDGLSYLQSDLGDVSLYSLIEKKGIDDKRVMDLIVDSLSLLARMQYKPISELDLSVCFPRQKMDGRSVMWDLNYFKYCFLKPAGVEFDEDSLENDFLKFSAKIEACGTDALIIRDFQSRNIMIANDRPYVIDFQGARLGCGLYDAVSFLWQARIGLTSMQREQFLAHYRKAVEQQRHSISDFDSKVHLMALFRTLQVLGAYGFRGYCQRNSLFLKPIEQAVENLRQLLAYEMIDEFPMLKHAIASLTQQSRFKQTSERNGLLVKVVSFSYRKGIPDDFSGNGGGFVFDCRAVHNPGRYDRYKSLTGRDADVIGFLESESEMCTFMDKCYGLVDASVEKYLNRGFTDLMVCFGCTGGRHRSVYGAEHMARHIHEKYGLDVDLIHREQNIVEKLRRT